MQAEETPVVDLIERHAELTQEYGSVLQQLKWMHAMLSIVIEEQGGLVEVSVATLESYSLNGSIKVYEDVARQVYIIEVENEDEQ